MSLPNGWGEGRHALVFELMHGLACGALEAVDGARFDRGGARDDLESRGLRLDGGEAGGAHVGALLAALDASGSEDEVEHALAHRFDPVS